MSIVNGDFELMAVVNAEGQPTHMKRSAAECGCALLSGAPAGHKPAASSKFQVRKAAWANVARVGASCLQCESGIALPPEVRGNTTPVPFQERDRHVQLVPGMGARKFAVHQEWLQDSSL